MVLKVKGKIGTKFQMITYVPKKRKHRPKIVYIGKRVPYVSLPKVSKRTNVAAAEDTSMNEVGMTVDAPNVVDIRESQYRQVCSLHILNAMKVTHVYGSVSELLHAKLEGQQ